LEVQLYLEAFTADGHSHDRPLTVVIRITLQKLINTIMLMGTGLKANNGHI
jgi:hypothetical protein